MPNTPERQTQPKRRRARPWKLAPPGTATFSLVLLEIGCSDHSRVADAIVRIVRDADTDLRARLAGPLPWRVEHGLSHADALLGQFELVCCDCISVFVCDTVLSEAPTTYLADLFRQLRTSSEFDLVSARLESLPLGAAGLAFLNRFFGKLPVDLPCEFQLMRKKARSMIQAADGIGARLIVWED